MAVVHVKGSAGSWNSTGSPNSLSSTNNTASSTSATVTFGNLAATSVGNVLLFWLDWGPGNTYTGTPVFSLAATGWTFNQIGGTINPSNASSAGVSAMFWAFAPNTAPATITVTVSGIAGYPQTSSLWNMNVDEWSGHDPTNPIDNYNSATGSASPSVNITPVNNNCAIWVGCDDNVTAVGTIGGVTATQGSVDGSNDWTMYRILTGGGGTQLSCTLGSGSYTIGAVSIKPAGQTVLPLVQTKTYASTASALTHSVTLNSTPAQGNLMILGVVSDATISGTPSGWSPANSAIDATGTYLYYKVAGSGESTTISVTLSSSDSCVLMAYEYSGNAASPFDQTASAIAQGSPCSTGTTPATGQAGELLFAIVGLSHGDNSPPDVTSWSNSFIQEASAVASGSTVLIRGVTATLGASSTGTYTTAATLSGFVTAHNSGIIATFKKLVSAGGTTWTLSLLARMCEFNVQRLA